MFRTINTIRNHLPSLERFQRGAPARQDPTADDFVLVDDDEAVPLKSIKTYEQNIQDINVHRGAAYLAVVTHLRDKRPRLPFPSSDEAFHKVVEDAKCLAEKALGEGVDKANALVARLSVDEVSGLGPEQAAAQVALDMQKAWDGGLHGKAMIEGYTAEAHVNFVHAAMPDLTRFTCKNEILNHDGVFSPHVHLEATQALSAFSVVSYMGELMGPMLRP